MKPATRIQCFLALAVGLSGCLAGCRTNRPGETNVLDSGGPLIPEQSAYDLRHVDLDLTIRPRKHRLSGVASLEVRALRALSWLVLDLDTPLRVERVDERSGDTKRRLEVERRGGRLWIPLGREIPAGQTIWIEIRYSGAPRVASRPPWEGGFTWSETEDGQPWIATTQQAEGADLWWPTKDHPSEKIESLNLRVTVPKPLVVAANGRLTSVLDRGDGTHTYVWQTALPISAYNVALNIAPYLTITDEFESIRGDQVPVTFWVLPENSEKGKKLLPELLEHLAFYERFLGPYPFRSEKYGIVETPHLGMEHQSIIAYGNRYRGGPHGYDWLHHHELGHEWWGNLVTARDWRHFWIHEGFCTYMQALYAEEREGRMAYHHAMYTSRGRVTSKHPMVPARPTSSQEMNKKVGSDVYFKGAWVLHTLRYLIGSEAFFECLRRMAYPTPEWESRIDGSACRSVTTGEFVELVNRVSGKKLDWFFDVYLYQAELPRLSSQREGEEVVLEWKVPEGLSFPMPLEIQVGDTIERVPMPEGRARLNAHDYRHGLLDPQSWILKKKRFVSLTNREGGETSKP